MIDWGRRGLPVVLMGLALCAAGGAVAAEDSAAPWNDGCAGIGRPAPPAPKPGGETVTVVCLWADKDGQSHIRELELDLHALPGAGRGSISDPVKVKNLWFRKSPPAQDFDWHVAPRRQFVITVGGGTAEITASDGTTRLVKPGDIVIAADVTGKGHKTRAFDGLPRDVLFIELDQ